MRKEIEALKNLIVAQDAEEAARSDMETKSRRFHATSIFGGGDPVKLPDDLQTATRKWAKAVSDLAHARGVARCLILDAYAEARATALHPRDEDNGPAARLPT